jgi:hypothetical protein
MFETLNEIMELSRENGYKFFAENKRGYTTVHPTLYGGKYFITESTHRNRRIYSIYCALKDGACDVVNGQVFGSLSQATRYMSMFLIDEDEQSEEVSYE